MSYLCPYPCEGRTDFGYCRYTCCINPLHSNLGNDNVKDYPSYLDYPKPRKSQTNADRIRAMSDEELAEKIGESIDCEVCKTMHHAESGECPCTPHQSCVDFWLDWLRQEAKE